jgi:hypothetical protein
MCGLFLCDVAMARVRLPGIWLVCLGGTALILLRMLFRVASAPDRAKSIAVPLDGARLEESNQQLTEKLDQVLLTLSEARGG